MTADATMARMREHLAALNPVTLTIRDDSHHHAGHAGAAGGGGHYHLTIVAEAFRGVPSLARHRMIHDALGPMLRSEIHALSIKASTPLP
ncbi:MAG: BolA family protein [Burkholderiales bacterium]